MSGLGLKYDPALGGFDLARDGDVLALDHGIATAVLTSLFSDARVDGDLPQGLDRRRGWWADTVEDRHGSLLWLLDREKATAETAARAEEYVRTALAWLIDEGIAESIEVEGVIAERHRLYLDVKVVRASSGQWAHLWDGVSAYREEVDGVVINLTAA